MGRRHERHARTQAGSEDTNPAVPLGRQPIHAGAHIHCRLPARMDRAAYVARHVVIRALSLRRFALGVIGHGHTECADATAIEQLCQPHMAIRPGIPLRQYDHYPTFDR